MLTKLLLLLYVFPCGRHILFFPPCMYVRPSVCPYVTLPYLTEPFVQNKNEKKIYR